MALTALPNARFHERLRGIYVILDSEVSAKRSLEDTLRQSLAGGARIFQYRNKRASMREACLEAMVLRKIAGDSHALFLVNDRCDLAMAVDADGVHLGQDDLPVADARAMLGPDRVIGLSTHTPSQVCEASRLPIDYIGYGPVFPTNSKPDHAPVVGIEGLRDIRPLITVPIFAIGGMTLDTVGLVHATGIDGVAVLSAIYHSSSVTSAVQELRASWR